MTPVSPHRQLWYFCSCLFPYCLLNLSTAALPDTHLWSTALIVNPLWMPPLPGQTSWIHLSGLHSPVMRANSYHLLSLCIHSIVSHSIAQPSTPSLVFISTPNDNEVLDGYTKHSTESDTYVWQFPMSLPDLPQPAWREENICGRELSQSSRSWVNNSQCSLTAAELCLLGFAVPALSHVNKTLTTSVTSRNNFSETCKIRGFFSDLPCK